MVGLLSAFSDVFLALLSCIQVWNSFKTTVSIANSITRVEGCKSFVVNVVEIGWIHYFGLDISRTRLFDGWCLLFNCIFDRYWAWHLAWTILGGADFVALIFISGVICLVQLVWLVHGMVIKPIVGSCVSPKTLSVVVFDAGQGFGVVLIWFVEFGNIFFLLGLEGWNSSRFWFVDFFSDWSY